MSQRSRKWFRFGNCSKSACFREQFGGLLSFPCTGSLHSRGRGQRGARLVLSWTWPLGVDVTKVIEQTAYSRNRSEIGRSDIRRHWGPGAFMISYQMEPEVDEKWEQEKTKAENGAIRERVPNKKFLTHESCKDTGKAGAFLKSQYPGSWGMSLFHQYWVCLSHRIK